jgi:ATP-binding cassette subfamily B protein
MDVVGELSDGLKTHVGERGVNLSGGQRQRLALARALLRHPRLVVLDEATSALDNETEAFVQGSIERLKTEAGVVVIAHRLTTVLGADRILVLDEGKIVEEGTHDQLVSKSGVYARLWALAQDSREEVS